MSQLLKKHNIEVPNELEKPIESSEHYHSVQGYIIYALSARVKSFPYVYDIYLVSNIS